MYSLYSIYSLYHITILFSVILKSHFLWKCCNKVIIIIIIIIIINNFSIKNILFFKRLSDSSILILNGREFHICATLRADQFSSPSRKIYSAVFVFCFVQEFGQELCAALFILLTDD